MKSRIQSKSEHIQICASERLGMPYKLVLIRLVEYTALHYLQLKTFNLQRIKVLQNYARHVSMHYTVSKSLH